MLYGHCHRAQQRRATVNREDTGLIADGHFGIILHIKHYLSVGHRLRQSHCVDFSILIVEINFDVILAQLKILWDVPVDDDGELNWITHHDSNQNSSASGGVQNRAGHHIEIRALGQGVVQCGQFIIRYRFTRVLDDVDVD